jgi:hypothetical protein
MASAFALSSDPFSYSPASYPDFNRAATACGQPLGLPTFLSLLCCISHLCLPYEFEHVYHGIVFEQGPQVCQDLSFAERDIFGPQISHHGPSLPSPLSALQ